MLGEDCDVSNQGLEENTRGTETSQHDLEAPRVTPEGDLESSPEPNSANCSTSHGERSEDRDPHICKDWPCPKCHPPRDTQEENRSRAVEAQQYSLRPAPGAQSSVFRSDPEPQRMEESESQDLHPQVTHGLDDHKLGAP